ncbi:nucleotidyltransferase domain-containing protein [Lederbergia sp. NSJ-179]|uniref:nucleotidyltransferase domain-containing protein n=1 Tax=Lederbergia sp. NSJ-179 TaxID=2931402 RepID=UPI001FD4DB43|nr:nucleotidyltransferase domain-containing protein [Lederbergia sp. NSJ-179]MCJ7840029.1 nucleotidyltransferase domain-containing protein [Lederbergia sp. NSJ-179]
MSLEVNVPQRFLDELLAYCLMDKRIEKVILYGSRARGDFNTTSDIDLAIYTAKNVSHTKQNIIEANIQEMPTHLKMDIVFVDRLKKAELLANIQREGVVLYEQQGTAL